MSTVQSHVMPGLKNPVMDAQALFRQLLDAMSQPGTLASTEMGKETPEGLHPATYAVALSLLDQDAPLKLTDRVNTRAIRDSLRFHNAIPLVDDFASADFVICDESERPDLDMLNVGSEAWPEQSCSLIIQCESFYKGIIYRAMGPGLQTSRKIRCSAFNGSLIHQREKLTQRFPLGIDLILTCGKQFFCIPRTTKLVAEQN